MNVAYVDTSCLVAIAFGERGATALARRLAAFDTLVASNLLEAELHAAFHREGADGAERWLDAISWISPDRPLSPEIAAVLASGYAGGADCWHLAAALYLSPEPSDIHFVTMDVRQGAVAKALGFAAW